MTSRNLKKLFTAILFMCLVTVYPPAVPAAYAAQDGNAVEAANYYVAPSGDDNNPGTKLYPFATLKKVWEVIQPGDLVYLRGGTYFLQGDGKLTGKNGTAGKMIRIWAYPGETPVITKAKSGYYSNMGIYFTGDYFHWKGIELTGFAQLQTEGNVSTGMFVTNSSYNIFEQIDSHHNGHGMRIQGANSTGNLVYNCDFHHNQDPYTKDDPYGNADGLEVAYIGNSCTNTVRGCRFWWNTDDGLDLWSNNGTLIVENCWAWYNGYIPDTFTSAGDGNGFKMGKTDDDYSGQLLRTVQNCISFKNKECGYNQNGANCIMKFVNNTSFANGKCGFFLYTFDIPHILRNNLGYKDGSSEFSSVFPTLEDHNSWDGGLTLSDSDFLSVSLDGVDGPRQEDGSLPNIGFMKLAQDSGLVDAGVDVGLPVNGAAPDIGAIEYSDAAAVPAEADETDTSAEEFDEESIPDTGDSGAEPYIIAAAILLSAMAFLGRKIRLQAK